MINLCVVSVDPDLAQQVASGLRDAGASLVEWLSDAGRVKDHNKSARNNRYLFVVQSPQAKLLTLLPTELSEQAFAEDLAQWYDKQSDLLKAYEANRASSILVTHESAVNDFSHLVQLINKKWRQRFSEDTSVRKDGSNTPNQHPLVGYLAEGLIEQTPNLRKMQALIEQVTGDAPRSFDVFSAMGAYRLDNQRRVKRLNDLEHQQQTLKTELISAQQSNQDLDAQLKDATEEGELILLQLHQVQEELENYFLKFKDAENRHTLLGHRWRQMLNRYPDYVDVEWVGVEPDAEGQVLRWQVKSLESAGVSREEVVFETFIEAGLLGVRFLRAPAAHEQHHARDLDDADASPNAGRTLARWPEVAASLDAVECIPAGRGEVKDLRAGVLKALSASDWALLKRIPRLVIQALDERPREGVDAELVKQAAKRLQEALDRLPATVRHDGLVLKNHQTNPDYEHLWLIVENLVLGERRWPRFELRLGAANIQGAKFSQHPKLEIPLIEGQTKPFESWFEESVDDFGAKWELRFDLKKQILDAGIWSALNGHEQALIRGLIAELVQGGGLRSIESGMRRGDRAAWERVFGQCHALLG